MVTSPRGPGSPRGTGHPFTPSILAYFSAVSQLQCHIPLPPFPPLSQPVGSRWSEFLGVWAGLTFLSSSLCPNLQKIVAFFFLAFFFFSLPPSLPFPLFPRELGTPARLCRHLGGPGGAVSFVPAAVWLLWGWCVCDPALVLAPAAGAGECGRRFGFVGGGLRGLGGGCELRGCSRRGTLRGARLSPAVGHRGDRALRAPALPAGPRSRRTDRWTPQPRRTPRPALHGRRQPCPGPAEDGVSPGRRRSRPLSDSDPPSLRARPPPASPPS